MKVLKTNEKRQGLGIGGDRHKGATKEKAMLSLQHLPPGPEITAVILRKIKKGIMPEEPLKKNRRKGSKGGVLRGALVFLVWGGLDENIRQVLVGPTQREAS